MLEAAADVLAEVEDARVGDVVEHLQALLAPAKNAGVGECLEVARDVRLCRLGDRDELGDVSFAGLEFNQEAEPHRFTQDAEPGGDDLEGLGREFLSVHAWSGNSVVDINCMSAYVYTHQRDDAVRSLERQQRRVHGDKFRTIVLPRGLRHL